MAHGLKNECVSLGLSSYFSLVPKFSHVQSHLLKGKLRLKKLPAEKIASAVHVLTAFPPLSTKSTQELVAKTISTEVFRKPKCAEVWAGNKPQNQLQLTAKVLSSHPELRSVTLRNWLRLKALLPHTQLSAFVEPFIPKNLRRTDASSSFPHRAGPFYGEGKLLQTERHSFSSACILPWWLVMAVGDLIVLLTI